MKYVISKQDQKFTSRVESGVYPVTAFDHRAEVLFSEQADPAVVC